ncbi:MAG: hypothetical protein P1S60_10795 [Anaerolineae bacterium]|nr:hypothetical protein [Anaerolineae bacterium]
MAKLRSRMVWGSLLIVAGLLFLLDSLGQLYLGSVWPVFFGFAGVMFLVTFFRDSSQWWPIIPGFTLIGLVLVILVDTVAPGLANTINGAIFLGSLGLGFLGVLLATGGRQWWAMIPGGVLVTLAVTDLLSAVVSDDVGAALFMFGFAGTFGLVYLFSGQGQRRGWALYPAVILTLIGCFALASAVNLGYLVWPLAFIGAGAYILIRTLTRDDKVVHDADKAASGPTAHTVEKDES